MFLFFCKLCALKCDFIGTKMENTRKNHTRIQTTIQHLPCDSMAVDSAKLITYTYLYITMIGTFFLVAFALFFGLARLKSVCLFSVLYNNNFVYLLGLLVLLLLFIA